MTPDSTSPNSHPHARARAPSVSARSPMTKPSGPHRSSSSRALGSYGLPATIGCTPDAAATAATSEPAPGTSPFSVGYVASTFVAMKRAPSRIAVDAMRNRSQSNLRSNPTTTASTGAPASASS